MRHGFLSVGQRNSMMTVGQPIFKNNAGNAFLCQHLGKERALVLHGLTGISSAGTYQYRSSGIYLGLRQVNKQLGCASFNITASLVIFSSAVIPLSSAGPSGHTGTVKGSWAQAVVPRARATSNADIFRFVITLNLYRIYYIKKNFYFCDSR